MKKERKVRSPLFYVGDKYKLIQEIKSYFPKEINCLIEPFVGGGSVFMNVPAKKYLLNDINTEVIALHELLCSYAHQGQELFDKLFELIQYYGLSCSLKEDIIPTSLKEQYKKTYYAKFNKEAYLHLRKDFNQERRKDYIKLYLLLVYGFNHMIRFNAKGLFNLPVGNVDFNKNVEQALLDYFQIVGRSNINLSKQDYRFFLDSLDLSNKDFIYCDPPYLITQSEYNKIWTSSEEIDLLKTLDHLDRKGVKFAISNVTHYKGNSNDIFIEWSKQYTSHNIKSNYISYHDNSIKSFREVLVINY